MKPIRAIRIDAERQTVTELVISSLEEAQGAVGGYIELGCDLDDSNDLYVDEEGRLKNFRHAFSVDGAPEPITSANV